MKEARLAKRTALVTGGGSGIGKATARLFLAEGAWVVVTSRDETKLRAVWEETGRDSRLSFHVCDVADRDQVSRLVAWATEQLGRIDILVNNAGVNIKRRAVRELTPETWRQTLGPNLDGAFYCIHAVLPQMLERRDGVIINVSSIAGKRASPLGGGAYAASKAGLSFLSHCLGIEEKDNGIRCSVIYPGEVDTPILEHRPQLVTAEHRRLILQPEDVAQAVLFVAALPPRVSVPELIIKPTWQPYG